MEETMINNTETQREGFTVQYYGVRGSIGESGTEVNKYGGHTACVLVTASDGTRIILDAGTGIRKLGTEWCKDRAWDGHAALLFSHTHHDHIQGLPFFGPQYDGRNTLTIHGVTRNKKPIEQVLKEEQNTRVFPARIGQAISYQEVKPREQLMIGQVTVTPLELNHPGGVTAYKLTFCDMNVVYATDNERPLKGTDTKDEALITLAREADLLILDAQYNKGTYRQGWGHRTNTEAAYIAKEARVKQLHYFHHDPGSTDETIDAMVKEGRTIFPATNAAHEGLVVALLEEEGVLV